MRRLLALLWLTLFLPAAPLAEDRATTKDAEKMVHKAVEYLKREGKEKAFQVFSDPRGPFTYRDLYVFVLDLNGVMRAHGSKPEFVGKNQMDRKDPTGKLITRDTIEMAKARGEGWIEYLWENPATGKTEHKVVYAVRVEDVVVGCGAFKP